MVEALKDEIPLRTLSGKDFGDDKEKWLKWWEKNKGNYIDK
jgi:hypothetical protein